MDDQHIYHHYGEDKPKINVKAEKNSRGTNYEATVTGASSPDEAIALLEETMTKLAAKYSVE